MKLKLSALWAVLMANSLFAQNPLPVGTVIPEDIIFSLGSDVSGAAPNFQINTFRESGYTQFDNQVLLVVYHASW